MGSTAAILFIPVPDWIVIWFDSIRDSHTDEVILVNTPGLSDRRLWVRFPPSVQSVWSFWWNGGTKDTVMPRSRFGGIQSTRPRPCAKVWWNRRVDLRFDSFHTREFSFLTGVVSGELAWVVKPCRIGSIPFPGSKWKKYFFFTIWSTGLVRVLVTLMMRREDGCSQE